MIVAVKFCNSKFKPCLMAVKLNSMHVSQQHDFLMYVEASAKVSFFNRWKHSNSLLHDASDYYACFFKQKPCI